MTDSAPPGDPGNGGLPTFFSSFGRLPGTWWILGVSIFAGLFEGIGLTMFVPLLAVMSDSGDEQSGIVGLVRRIFDRLDLPLSVPVMLAVITVLILTGFFLGYVQRRAAHKAFNDYILELRHRLMRGLLYSSWPHLAKRATGEVINNLILETSQTSTGLMMQLHLAIAAIQIVILGIFSATLSPQLILIVAAFSGLIVLASRPFLRKSNRLGIGLTEANQRFGFHTVDYLQGASLIKTTASEAPTLAKIDRFSEQVYRMRLGIDLLSALFQFMLQAAPVFLIAAIIFVAHGALELAAASILTFLLLIARIMPRVGEVQQRYQSYLSYRPAFAVIDRMLAECARNEELVSRGGDGGPAIEGGLQLDKVSFRFPDDEKDTLMGVSLDIPRNQMVALVGSSGAGKTTLINLLAGLYKPSEGRILVDGADLESIDLRAWRSRIGYVTQDVVTFNDTIRNNLLFAHPGASDAAIGEALRIAHLEEFISSLADGLDTVVSENGVRLSGGQKQRLALARAMIGQPQLLLLDEATSALDNESERIVQQAIETLAHRVTIVVVAHRLSTVSKADVIHVLEDGRIVESGSYTELLEQNGRFAQLHGLQFA